MWLINLLRRIRFKRRAAPADGASGEPPPEQHKGSRIAVLGHTGSGKTVFYTMLWATLRDNPEIQLEAEDADTGRELTGLINLMRGLREERNERGEFVDASAPRRFPPGTKDVVEFRFRAMVRGRDAFPFQAKEYQGELLDLKNLSQVEDYVKDFFRKADCIVFLIEPASYRSEVQRTARMTAFNILLQKTVGWRTKTDIPVALVVSKADMLDGFHDESQVALIPERLRFARLGSYEQLRDTLLAEPSVCAEPAWRKSVAEALDRLRELIRSLLAQTREFQIFFVSSVGSVEKIVNEYGEEEVIPPAELRPIGLEKPFLWYVEQARRRGRIRRARRVASWMIGISLVWMLVLGCYALPHWIAHDRIASAVFTDRITSANAQQVHPWLWFFLTGREKELLANQGSEKVKPDQDLRILIQQMGEAGCPPDSYMTSCIVPAECQEALKVWQEQGRSIDLVTIQAERTRRLTADLDAGPARLSSALESLDPTSDPQVNRVLAEARRIVDCQSLRAPSAEWIRAVDVSREIVRVIGDDKILLALDYPPTHEALNRYGASTADHTEFMRLGTWLCGHATRAIEAKSQGLDPAGLNLAIENASTFLSSMPTCSAFHRRVRDARAHAGAVLQELNDQVTGSVAGGEGGSGNGGIPGGAGGTEGVGGVGGSSGPPGASGARTPGPYALHLKLVEITPGYHLHVKMGEEGKWEDEPKKGGDVVNVRDFNPQTAIRIGVSTFQACQEGAQVLEDIIIRGAPHDGEYSPGTIPEEITFRLPDGREVKAKIEKMKP